MGFPRLALGVAACGASGAPSGTTTNAASEAASQFANVDRNSPTFQRAVAVCNNDRGS
jgi:hypothetical protein